jgi:uncharacterized delta-60 repeat protein
MSSVLDATFGGGVVSLASDTSVVGRTTQYDYATPQSDGKIIVAGEVTDAAGAAGVALARYTAEGALDETFGSDGLVDQFFGDGGFVPDGHFLVTPDDQIVSEGIEAGQFALARFDSSGTLDQPFGLSGVASIPFAKRDNEFGAPDAALSVLAPQSNGKLLALVGAPLATASSQATPFLEIGGLPTASPVFSYTLVRFSENGSLDSTFGSDGMFQLPGKSESAAMTILGNDQIITLEAQWSPSGQPISGLQQGLVVRLTADGVPDDSFGGTGEAPSNLGLRGGPVFELLPSITSPDEAYVLFDQDPISKMLPNGGLDTAFAVQASASQPAPTDRIALDSNDHLVAARVGTTGIGTPARENLTRLYPSGILDPNFGVAGKTAYPLPGDSSALSYLFVDQDDRPVLLDQNHLVRFAADGGTPDLTPPTATMAAPLIQPGQTLTQLVVTYTDNTAIELTNIPNHLSVSAPDDLPAPACSLSSTQASSDGITVTATYNLTPPDGRWNGLNNGNHSVTIGPFRDTGGNGAEATATFNVNVPDDSAPTAQITSWSAPSVGRTTGIVRLDFAVTFDSPAGLDDGSLDSAGAVTLTDRYGTLLANATPGSVSNGPTATSRIVQYEILVKQPDLPDGSLNISLVSGVIANANGIVAPAKQLKVIAVLHDDTSSMLLSSNMLSPSAALAGRVGAVLIELTNLTLTPRRLWVQIDLSIDSSSSSPGTFSDLGRRLYLPWPRVRLAVPAIFRYPTSNPDGEYDLNIEAGLTGVVGAFPFANYGASTGTIQYGRPFTNTALSSLTVLSATKQRHPLAVRLLLTNLGNSPAIGPAQFSIVASTDATASVDDRALLTRSGRLFLPAGATRVVVLVFLIPKDLPAGAYELIATLTPDPSLHDNNAADKSVTASVIVS